MKAKKVFTMYGKHSDVVTYEYRGMQYDVEYAKDWTYMVTSPKVQHEDAQSKINKILDDPVNNEPKQVTDWDEEWKTICEMMEW